MKQSRKKQVKESERWGVSHHVRFSEKDFEVIVWKAEKEQRSAANMIRLIMHQAAEQYIKERDNEV